MGTAIPEGSAAPEQPKETDTTEEKPVEQKNKTKTLLVAGGLGVLVLAAVLIGVLPDWGDSSSSKNVSSLQNLVEEEPISDSVLAIGTNCTSTRDCEGFSDYCAAGTCMEGGQCFIDADCSNPENMYPVIECVGPISCAPSGLCGRTCAASFCPEEEPTVQCLVSPCEVLDCTDEVVNCVDDYCGGCNVFAFDEAGFQVCTGDEEVEVPSNNDTMTSNETSSAPGCSSFQDCGEDEYCAGAECLPDGQCITDLDCKNPDNVYALALCVGVIGCYEDGMCGIECGDSFCPTGSSPTNCLVAPCQFPPTCEESWEYCINDTCNGECGVKLLDAAGNEITCTPV